jgi:hypothetical protein
LKSFGERVRLLSLAPTDVGEVVEALVSPPLHRKVRWRGFGEPGAWLLERANRTDVNRFACKCCKRTPSEEAERLGIEGRERPSRELGGRSPHLIFDN